jgi:steroid delta-isomerase-like uncharacterized protein
MLTAKGQRRVLLGAALIETQAFNTSIVEHSDSVHGRVAGTFPNRMMPTTGGTTLDIVDQHFTAENAHDVPGTLATYTDDIVWDDVTHPLSPVRGKEAVGAVYSDIIAAIPDVHFVSVRRFTSEDGQWVVDESDVTGHVEGDWAGVSGEGAPVEIRILHLFQLRDGLIAYENTWFDSAAVARQVEAWKATQA